MDWQVLEEVVVEEPYDIDNIAATLHSIQYMLCSNCDHNPRKAIHYLFLACGDIHKGICIWTVCPTLRTAALPTVGAPR